jgi:hypothetical protein
VSNQYAFHVVNPNHRYAHGIKLFADNRVSLWGILQSRVHEAWSRAATSTLGTSLRYTTSSCFDTFPFADVVENPRVISTAEAYLRERTDFLSSAGMGATRLYGRFNQKFEREPSIIKLRDLHSENGQRRAERIWRERPRWPCGG